MLTWWISLAERTTKEKNPDAPVYLHTLHPVVRERFTFFFASLRTLEHELMKGSISNDQSDKLLGAAWVPDRKSR